MSAACATPLGWEELVAYWAGDLEPTEVDRLDEHLMGCGVCTAESARVAALAAAMRGFIPHILDHAMVAALRARGLRITENPLLPDERRPVVFGLDTDVLLHRLRGLDLSAVERVTMRITVEETGALLHEAPSPPFDRDSGEILIACQRHFASMPPNIVAKVRMRDAAGAERVARYPIPHIYASSET